MVLTIPPKKGHQPTWTSPKKAGGKKKKKAPAAAPPEDVPAPGDAVPAAAEEVGQEDAPPPVDVPAPEDDAADDEATRSPRSPSPPRPVLEIKVEVHAPPAAAGDKASAESGDEDADPRLQPAVGKSKEKAKPKRDFSLEVEQEERLLKWMVEHDEVWRRGHRLYKKRKEIWGAMAAELGVSVEHVMGWWKSVKDWYVRLNKVKSGQAAKKYTDREQFILDNCKFYNTQLRSTVSAPMVSLQRSEPILQARGSESEPDSDQEQAPTPLDDLEVMEMTSAEANRASNSQSRPSKKRKRGKEREEEWMKDLRETMKANQQFLTQLVQEKPAQSSERGIFIKYVSESLRAAPEEQYKQLKTRFFALLDAACQETAPAAQPARATLALPVFQQPQQSQQYQHSQQYQQQAPQYQLFQQ